MRSSEVSSSQLALGTHPLDLFCARMLITPPPAGANMKNASLITEVEDLNRKVREMLEQVREKDRQISKLQGNYSKATIAYSLITMRCDN